MRYLPARSLAVGTPALFVIETTDLCVTVPRSRGVAALAGRASNNPAPATSARNGVRRLNASLQFPEGARVPASAFGDVDLVDRDEELSVRPRARAEEEDTELGSRVIAVTARDLGKANCRNRRVGQTDRIDVRRYDCVLWREAEALEAVNTRLQRGLVHVRRGDVLRGGCNQSSIRLDPGVGESAAGRAGCSGITLWPGRTGGPCRPCRSSRPGQSAKATEPSQRRDRSLRDVDLLNRPILDLRAADAVSRQRVHGGERCPAERKEQSQVRDEMSAHVACDLAHPSLPCCPLSR